MTEAILQNADVRRIAASFSGVVHRRNTIPILGCLKFEVSAGRVRVSGTDLDVELCLDFEADTDGKGAFMVDFQMLRGLARASVGPVTFRVADRNDKTGTDILEITDDDMTMRANLHLPVEDYPSLAGRFESPEWKTGSVAWSMSQKQCDRIIRAARHCISHEETRYYLNGLHLTTRPDGDTLRAVSTDGHRMAVVDTDVSIEKFQFVEERTVKGEKTTHTHGGIILPEPAMKAIRAHLKPDANEPAGFRVTRTFGQVTLPGADLRFRLIDGTYPTYTRVIPEDTDGLSAHLSLAGVRRLFTAASAFGQKNIHCKLDCRAGHITASGPGGESVTLPMQGKALNGHDAIGFNLRYLHDQARVTPSFSVTAKDPGAAALIRGDDPDAFWVLMPTRILG